MIPKDHIEAAISVECRISLAIYVEREKWQKMTESEKLKMANEAISRCSAYFNSGEEYETGINENAIVEITQDDLTTINDIEVYDPHSDEMKESS